MQEAASLGRLRGVERGDVLARRGYEFVVDEEASGLRVAVPVGCDDFY